MKNAEYMKLLRRKRKGSSRRRLPKSLKGLKPKTSSLENEFILMWNVSRGPKLEREHKFHPTRKWRFDFAHVPSSTAIELEGGAWSGGRHTRPAGFIADCEKYNAAVMLGWRIYRIPTDLLTTDYVNQIKTTHFGPEPFYGKQTE
jgi:hypothetical protein